MRDYHRLLRRHRLYRIESNVSFAGSVRRLLVLKKDGQNLDCSEARLSFVSYLQQHPWLGIEEFRGDSLLPGTIHCATLKLSARR